jgi:acetolactate synthase-1/2/3 large subunit
MAELNGGQLIQKVFSKEGIRYIFGIPGGHIYPMMEACAENGIPFIGVRNEMTAAFMAEGWALTTGDVGVCTGTAGPGVTNLVTGLANASCNMAPVLCMAGKARTSEFDRNELQDFDQLPMMTDMTKHARSVPDGHRIPEYVGRAISIAKSDRPGPVYLEIPRDRMEGLYDESKVEFQETYVTKSRPAAGEADLKKAAEMINSAKQPMIIAGSGAFFSGASEVLTKFIEKTGIPVFTRNAGRGMVPDTHPLAICIAASRHPVCATAIRGSDLIIMLGTRTGFTLMRDTFPKGTTILRVDINAASLNDQLEITHGIAGDIRTVLEQLLPIVDKRELPEWVGMLNQTLETVKMFTVGAMQSDQNPIHPLRLCADLAKRIDKATIIVLDGGDTVSWGAMTLPAMGPGQFLTIVNGSFGPLGVGLPYAMAAKLAHPDKKVVLLTGDGAFGYGAMEYDTCMRYGINITTVILNDSCWGMIKNSEAKKAGKDKEFVGLYLRDVRYDEVVKALGGYGEHVTQAEDIGPAIDRALASELPSIVNVMTDVNIAFMF